MAATLDNEVAELRRANAALQRKLEEGLAREAATAEILGLISTSNTEIDPTLNAIAAAAQRLCAGANGVVFRFDGSLIHFAAHSGLTDDQIDAIRSAFPLPPGRDSVTARSIMSRQVVHVADLASDPEFKHTALIRAGLRGSVSVPMLREGKPIGAITVTRREIEPFTDQQIDLLKTFASQAVIAMENARLITETREALEQQTATAEVLGIINSSPGDLAPVFDTMLEKAVRLCEANFGILWRFDAELAVPGATYRVPPAFAEAIRKPRRPTPESGPARMMRGDNAFAVADLTEFQGYRSGDVMVREITDLGGARSVMVAPLRRDGHTLGCITIYRREVRPFTEKQVALLESFAAQAVVAMENARLLTETREALQQQTATAEVLGVINSSPGDLTPVFDAILEKAHSLCDIAQGSLELYDGESFRAVATRGLSDTFADMLRQGTPAAANPATRPLIEGSRFAYIPDLAETEFSVTRTAAETEAIRTLLCVPLRREGALLGMIASARHEVRPFSEKEIALLENFAAQAVIAMENARLITETREALAQQTATAEVLGVINSSPGDLGPVFDAMLEKAMRLCDAAFGTLLTYDGEKFHPAAALGVPEAFAEFRKNHPPDFGPTSGPGRILQGLPFDHTVDAAEDELFRSGDPRRRALVELGGARTLLGVPLRKENAVLGVFTIYRQEVRPFTEKQIALLQNFAAQAVIAMENARLLTETREALERQTATSEVLEIVSSSPGHLEPVFEAILTSAVRICGGRFGMLAIRDGDGFRGEAAHGLGPEFTETLSRFRRPAPGTSLDIVQQTKQTMQVPDCLADPAYEPVRAMNPAHATVRSHLCVPMLKDDQLLGAILIYRDEVLPFTDKQTELVENFAKQAAIAIENTRLITETQSALEQQTATAEVLGVINASPGALSPVFDAMLERALHLCEAASGLLWAFDGGQAYVRASRDVPAKFLDHVNREPPGAGPETFFGRAIQTRSFIHSADIAAEEPYRKRVPLPVAAVELGGIHTALFVPLIKDDGVPGIFSIFRREVRTFSGKQIALLQNFAAQAVIAMENARLITETREALEQQTATAEVLGVINSSPGDLMPVFDAILEKAHNLCGIAFGSLQIHEDGKFRAVAVRGIEGPLAEVLRQPILARPDSPPLRLIQGERFVQISDMIESAKERPDDPRARASAAHGLRTVLFVPLRKDADLLGYLSAFRTEVRPFSDKEIALLENFAAQAVIAMENVRLLIETRESLEQQTATAQVLDVISRADFNLQSALEAVVGAALRLCKADNAGIYREEAGTFRWAAGHLQSPEYERIERAVVIHRGVGTLVGRTALEGRPVQILDALEDPLYEAKEDLKIQGGRTLLGVPLLREGETIGVIGLGRDRVEGFSEREISLVTSFAAQAVIAIENARLLDELRQRQQELRVTFDNMGDAVAMFDASLHLAAWNRNFQDLLQLPDSILTEHPAFDDYLRYLTQRGEFGTADANAEIARLRARLTDHYSFERTRPDGTVIEVRHNPMPDGGVVLIYSDITERKRSEEKIRAARDAAEAAYSDLKAAQSNLVQAQKMAALGQLTAGIAHEIKNPLNFVNNFAGLSVELLEELKETAAPALDALDEGTRADVDETIELLSGNLEKIAEHGKRAVKSMLEHSRGVSGERRKVDLNGLIDEALKLAYHGARAQDQGFNITMERDFDPALQPIEVAPQEMTRVFLNLFGNGFYAANKRSHDNGGVPFHPTLTVSTRDQGDAIEVRVRDNGTGIPPEIKDKLFQPFFTTKPTGEGTGLGLSISYDIVTQQHGGSIEVDSEVGKFTEFRVRLPRRFQAPTMGAAA